MKLTKQEVINIAEALGFHLDYDQWDVKDTEWMRFQLPEELDEQHMRLIWYKNSNLTAISRAKTIIFQAGQKYKIQQINKLENFI